MCGVEGELGEDFAGVGCDDGGVVVVDQADDLGAGVGSADADVEHASGVAEADLSVRADGVVVDSPEIGIGRRSRCCFRDELVSERGGVATQGAMRAAVVVVVAERVEGVLQCCQGRGLASVEVFFSVCQKRSILP